MQIALRTAKKRLRHKLRGPRATSRIRQQQDFWSDEWPEETVGQTDINLNQDDNLLATNNVNARRQTLHNQGNDSLATTTASARRISRNQEDDSLATTNTDARRTSHPNLSETSRSCLHS
ncbi:uncharacterized protein LOC105839902 [Monomorium pharaonis]|uniref:uncharacterized protein LOC105839902 n=1 Tax=Monomorium pharaonis TaxID=307658 RepID=UPI00102E0FE9|nr:uncharacterized protein LOC105839902 [Monomorium pharaonis]